jgi:hypothetical protein
MRECIMFRNVRRETKAADTASISEALAKLNAAQRAGRDTSADYVRYAVRDGEALWKEFQINGIALWDELLGEEAQRRREARDRLARLILIRCGQMGPEDDLPTEDFEPCGIELDGLTIIVIPCNESYFPPEVRILTIRKAMIQKPCEGHFHSEREKEQSDG